MGFLKNKKMKTIQEEYFEIKSWVDTGSYALNALISGDMFKGIPGNAITQFAGESTTGKTYFTLGIVKNFQKRKNDAEVVLCDSEGALNKSMLISRGLDETRTVREETLTIEEFKNYATKVMEEYGESKTKGVVNNDLMIVLDSLGMLSSDAEVSNAIENKNTADLKKPQLIKAAFRILTGRCSKYDVPLIITNHIYATMDKFNPFELSGGKAAKYASTTTILLTKSNLREVDGDGEKGDVIGSKIKCTLHKGRLAKEKNDVVVRLTHAGGLDRYYGLHEIIKKYDIFKVDKRLYWLPTGVEGTPEQIKEAKESKETSTYFVVVHEDDLLSKPKLYYNKNILNTINEVIKKEFVYGGPSEDEMLEDAEGLSDGVDDIDPEEDLKPKRGRKKKDPLPEPSDNTTQETKNE